jgi:hypothetical protein
VPLEQCLFVEKGFSFKAVAAVVRFHFCSLMNERNYLLKALLVCRMSSRFGSYVTFPEILTNIYWLPSSTSSQDKYLTNKAQTQAISNEFVGQRIDHKPFFVFVRLNRFNIKFYFMNFKCFCGTKKSRF